MFPAHQASVRLLNSQYQRTSKSDNSKEYKIYSFKVARSVLQILNMVIYDSLQPFPGLIRGRVVAFSERMFYWRCDTYLRQVKREKCCLTLKVY